MTASAGHRWCERSGRKKMVVAVVHSERDQSNTGLTRHAADSVRDRERAAADASRGPTMRHPASRKYVVHTGLVEWRASRSCGIQRRHGSTLGSTACRWSKLNRCSTTITLVVDDPDHSESEDRFILLGLSEAARVLIVVHVYRKPEGLIRILSARKVTPRERAGYDRGSRP